MTVFAVFDLTLKEEVLDEAPSLISESISHTRARPGCLGADVSIDIDDPKHWLIVERWQDIESNEAYREWRRTPEGASPLKSLLAEPPRAHRFEVNNDI